MNAARADRAHSDTAVAFGDDGPLTRAAFWRRVQCLSTALAAHPAQRWALVCEDGTWFAAGLLALANNRRTVVLPQAPQAGSLGAEGAPVDAVLTDRAEEFAGFTVLAAEEPASSTLAPERWPEDDAQLEFYTSGSNGAPKCVPKAFAQLRREMEALEREWGAQLGGASVTGTVPHYHLYGLLFRILWPLWSGRAFFARPGMHPAALRAARGKCIVVSSPAFLSRVNDPVELPPAERVAALFSSGAPLPDATAEKLVRHGGRAAIEVYGSTETGGVAWRAWQGAAERALWTPINGVQIELREEAAGPRLWVRSGCTWQGEWMPTGDLARVEKNRFALLGRADDVVKFEDKRISLSEMRTRLLQHVWVQDARLLLLPGPRPVIGAIVILNATGQSALTASGKPAVRAALRAWLRGNYEAILIPRKWRFPQTLPGNDMGKTPLAALQQLFEPRA